MEAVHLLVLGGVKRKKKTIKKNKLLLKITIFMRDQLNVGLLLCLILGRGN